MLNMVKKERRTPLKGSFLTQKGLEKGILLYFKACLWRTEIGMEFLLRRAFSPRSGGLLTRQAMLPFPSSLRGGARDGMCFSEKP